MTKALLFLNVTNDAYCEQKTKKYTYFYLRVLEIPLENYRSNTIYNDNKTKPDNALRGRGRERQTNYA